MPTLYGYPVCSCIVASAPLVERRFREAGMIQQSFDGLITQGCYSAGAVTASAGTHDGGGVLDLTDFTPYRAEADILFTACGWVDFYRPYGVLYARSDAHHHVVLNGCPHLAQGAQNQIRDAKVGLNGLAGKGKDEGPRPLVTWQQALADDGGITLTQEDDMKLLRANTGECYLVTGFNVQAIQPAYVGAASLLAGPPVDCLAADITRLQEICHANRLQSHDGVAAAPTPTATIDQAVLAAAINAALAGVSFTTRKA